MTVIVTLINPQRHCRDFTALLLAQDGGLVKGGGSSPLNDSSLLHVRLASPLVTSRDTHHRNISHATSTNQMPKTN